MYLKNQIVKSENELEFSNSNVKEYERLYEENSYSVESLREKEICNINNDIYKIEKEIENYKYDLDTYKNLLTSYKEEGEKLKNKEIKIENDSCSTCGQLLPEEHIKKVIEDMKKSQVVELEEIKSKYDSTKEKATIQENKIKELKCLIEEKQKELENINSKTYEILEETDKQKQIRIRKEECELNSKFLEKAIENYKKELKENETIFDTLEIPMSNSEDNLPLKLELDEINEKLATTITLNKLEDDVNNCYKELETKRTNKELNKEKMQEVIKFNNVKADLLSKKVKNYFSLTNFKTKELTQSGDEVETFKITNDKGVEWKEINTGQQILIGIDLLCGIQKAKDLSIPIIIDNFETLTSQVELENTQLILAQATKNIFKLEVE